MAHQRWTWEEIKLLRELYAQGLRGAHAMAPHFADKKIASITSKLSYLHLVDPVKSAKAKKRKILDKATFREFRAFLKENVKYYPPIELTRRWNETRAGFNGLQKVTHDHTRYLLKKMRIRLSKEEAKNNSGYRVAYRKIRRKAGQTGRKTADQAAAARRAALEKSRDEIFRLKPKHPRHHCPRCKEDWPLTKEFFRLREDGHELSACRQCINDTRRKLSRLRKDNGDTILLLLDLKKKKRTTYDAKWERVIESAKKLRKAIFKEQKGCPRQTCICCEEVWPTQRDFFSPPREEGGGFSRLCRFCVRGFKRRIDRARADHQEVGPIKREREKLLNQARDLERQERRKRLRKKAQEVKGVERRRCPTCPDCWPFTKEYWLFRTYQTASGPSECLDKASCRCCVNDQDVRRRRGEKPRCTKS